MHSPPAASAHATCSPFRCELLLCARVSAVRHSLGMAQAVSLLQGPPTHLPLTQAPMLLPLKTPP